MMNWQLMGDGSWLWMIACILVAVGVVLLVVSAIDAGRRRGADDEPIEILRERFARAEIDADQFTKAKQTLGPSRRATLSIS